MRGRQHCDMTLVIDHAAVGCESREHVKAVLDDHAQGVFQAKVIVRPGAQQTDGRQMAQALLPLLFARPPILPRKLVPLEELPPGSAGGSGAKLPFARSFKHQEPEGTPCAYCGQPTTRAPGPDKFHREHVIPRSRGGNNGPENYLPACRTCNLRKGPNLSGMDAKTQRMVRLFHPRRHTWSRHFRWQGAILVGRTPVGRATVAVLAINLPKRVVQRQALMEEGVFPQ